MSFLNKKVRRCCSPYPCSGGSQCVRHDKGALEETSLMQS